ncbi:DUF4127 family protein [Cohnella herbarum]|uniref:DUF4127 family protein n=1 Tax=Cohnella herbarum TaxID=2728023 RepID=A0A7Z2VN27_9BACL|nr:DUF4127 family protein [Cohnella herbarum]QJD86041.1 DUF4127 family protein [Cohnella herbarum]
MPAIVYVPLDERPCNAGYPVQIAAASDVDMISPPPELLGNKKQPADTAKLSSWLLENASTADRLILSIDMIVYGGIVPSRLHSWSFEQCADRLRTIAECKRINPHLRVYAFNLIMRAPSYSSSEEEPDYYAEYGAELARSGWLQDKLQREGWTEEERAESVRIAQRLPVEVRDDFISRRQTNASVNRLSVDLAREGVIDFLIIPLDDNAKYGYTAQEQRKLLQIIERDRLMDRVHMYPGADEIGCTMFSRVFCELKGYRPEVFIRHASTNGPFIIPKYEDRSLGESLKSHLTAAGAFICDGSADADVVLMVNSPPIGAYDMAETDSGYEARHASYFSEVGLREFVQAIRAYSDKGKLVALADVATCNGGDESLMNLVSDSGLLPRLSAYAGWNTSGNTLGTVIAHAIVESYYRLPDRQPIEGREHSSKLFYWSRLLEDWGYQAVVRTDIVKNDLEALGGSYFHIAHIQDTVIELIDEKMKRFLAKNAADLPLERIRIRDIRLPWDRMFEVGFRLEADPIKQS